MKLVVACATAALMLSGCGEPSGGNQAAEAPAANASAANAAAPSANPLGAPVSGDQAKKLMHDRHEGMEDIGDAFKVIAREGKAPSPDLEALRKSAGTIATLAPQVSGWFPPGTGPDVGKTRAKAEIWQKPDDYAAKVRGFQQAAQAFNAAAQGGDLAAIRSAQANLGKSCKGCHDLYRSEEKKHD